MVNENAPQLQRCNGVEVSAVNPVDRFRAADPQVCFVQHGRSLQRVRTSLAPHLSRGYPVEFGIDDSHEPAGCVLISRAPLVKQGRYRHLVIVSYFQPRCAKLSEDPRPPCFLTSSTKIREIYENSLELPISERTAYIDGQCDGETRAEVEAIVASA